MRLREVCFRGLVWSERVGRSRGRRELPAVALVGAGFDLIFSQGVALFALL